MMYRIANWDEEYETSETRKLKSLSWIPVPNKHDGLGFRRISIQPNAVELFAAWNLILQVASKGGPKERGVLEREGVALGAEELSVITGFPVTIFESAIDFFSSPKMRWILPMDSELPEESPESLGDSPEPSGNSAERIEGNRTEEYPPTPHGGDVADLDPEKKNLPPEEILDFSEKNLSPGGGMASRGFPSRSELGRARRDEKRRKTCPESLPVMKDLSGCVRNRSRDRLWTWAEYEALLELGRIDPEDLAVVAAYAEAVRKGPKEKDFRKRELLTLLNDWSGYPVKCRGWLEELEKAGPDPRSAVPGVVNVV